MPKQPGLQFKPGNLLSSVSNFARRPFGYDVVELGILGLVGTVIAAAGIGITYDFRQFAQNAEFNETLRDNITMVFNDRSYRLVDDETVEVVAGNTLYEYDFDARIETITLFEDDIAETRDGGYDDSDNTITFQDTKRFEDLNSSTGHQLALDAGIQIATNLQTAFADAEDYSLLDDEEIRSDYERYAREFLEDFGSAVIGPEQTLVEQTIVTPDTPMETATVYGPPAP